MALETRDLIRTYGERRVVDQLSLSVEPGEILGLLGPNGAGKTTTFYMMIGFVAATAGRVLIDGEDISRLPFYRRARRGIGYLPQEPSVFVHATVRENLRMALQTAAPKDATASRCAELLDEFRLSPLAGQRAQTLSGGERRRLEIARSLAARPRYILLDEPFSGIDPISVAELQEEIGSIRGRGLGIVITDHNVRDTLSITDRTCLIDQGKLIAQGTPEEILKDPVARRTYLGERFRA